MSIACAKDEARQRNDGGLPVARWRRSCCPGGARDRVCLVCDGADAARAAADTTALAKEQQNPISSMATIPWQMNFNSGGGLEDGTFFLLNVQPVMPFKVTDRWNMIVRTIVPFVSAPGPEGTQLHRDRRHPGADLPDAVQGRFVHVGRRPGRCRCRRPRRPPCRPGSWAAGPTLRRAGDARAVGGRSGGEQRLDLR